MQVEGQLVALAWGHEHQRAIPSGSCPLCFGSGRLPPTGRGAPRPVVLGSSIGLEPLELAAASQVLFGAQGAGLSDQGEGDPLHQVLVQWSLAPAV